jgi:hypothetical protein
MRLLVLCGMMVAVAGCVIASVFASGDCADANKVSGGKQRHVVIFKFKDSATPEQIKQVEDAFRELPKKIPEILDFEWGTNNSPEHLNQGFTHCFFLTFRDADARAVYLPHPAHKAFGKLLHPYLEKVMVIDYVAKD